MLMFKQRHQVKEVERPAPLIASASIRKKPTLNVRAANSVRIRVRSFDTQTQWKQPETDPTKFGIFWRAQFFDSSGGLSSRVLGGWLSKRSRPVPHAASAELSVLRSGNKHFCSSISEGPGQSGPREQQQWVSTSTVQQPCAL